MVYPNEKVFEYKNYEKLIVIALICIFSGGILSNYIDIKGSDSEDILILLVTIFFGGLGFLKIGKQCFKNPPKLILNREGLNFTENAVFVAWTDILEIKAKDGKKVYIYLKDPDKYIEKLTDANRSLALLCVKVHGTPLVILSSQLVSNFAELSEDLEEYLSRSRRYL